jgi:murein DD-endopeptidase MepM/ murein hydrolase activator NlpD
MPRGCAALLLLPALGAGSAAPAEPRCLDDARVCLEVHEQQGVVAFEVANHEAAPYTVRISLPERHNLEARAPLPFRAVIEPGQQQRVGSLVPRDPRQPTRYALRWGAAAGDARARHDDGARYRMPFGGAEPRTLAAGPGADTHRSSSLHAFDFGMPWGTPVLAARAGRVVRVVDAYGTGALRRDLLDRSNRVELLHADGTLATYAHLRRGIPVRVGQLLATGELLGFSGASGYAGEPHLHFEVWRRQADLSAQSLPVRFHDGSAPGFAPAVGVAYAPGCGTAGAGCAAGELPPVSEPLPAAARREGPSARGLRREDGACVCPNGAVIYVELRCDLVCGGS